MNGLSLSYRIEDSPARALFERLGHVDTRPMFDDIGAYLVSYTTKRFLLGVGPDGTPWTPSRRALGDRDGIGKTLVDRGHLRDSITHQVFLDGSGVQVGSDMVYAAIHQFGGDAGRNHAVHLPARPFLGINGEDEAEIDRIVANHMRAVLA